MERSFSIGVLAREAGIKVQTVRYYEEIGLLPPPARTDGNQRRYDGRARSRLNFIRHARELGFPLDAIRDLLALSDRPDHSCEEVDAIARRHLRAVEQRLHRLACLREELTRMVNECAAGSVAQCRIIEVLSEPPAGDGAAEGDIREPA